MSEEALQRAEERRDVKSEEKKERDTQLNAEFQRLARREEKTFLNEKYKETGEKGKTKDLSQKIGDIKGLFCARMDMIKDRNGKDLTEAEETKKRL